MFELPLSPAERRRAILIVLSRRGPQTIKQLARVVGGDRHAVGHALSCAWFVQRKHGFNPIFELSEAGQAEAVKQDRADKRRSPRPMGAAG
jgi:hypothetical protein